LCRIIFVPSISLVELEYLVSKRKIEKEVLPTAKELRIGVIAFGVLSHIEALYKKVIQLQESMEAVDGRLDENDFKLIENTVPEEMAFDQGMPMKFKNGYMAR